MTAAVVQMMCEACGGSDVSRDGWAEWDVARQVWRLAAVFDDYYCHSCHRPVQLRAESLATIPPRIALAA